MLQTAQEKQKKAQALANKMSNLDPEAANKMAASIQPVHGRLETIPDQLLPVETQIILSIGEHGQTMASLIGQSETLLQLQREAADVCSRAIGYQGVNSALKDLDAVEVCNCLYSLFFLFRAE